jgi:excisionase family DNA binding protein
VFHPADFCINFEGDLYRLPQAAKKLGISQDHLIALVDDGDIQFINVARRGAKRREIRFTEEQLDLFVEAKTCNPRAVEIKPKKTKTKVADPVTALEEEILREYGELK